MSFERSSRGPGGGPDRGPAASPLGPGKQTLTAQLDAAIVQQRAAQAPEADVHAAAAHGTRGSATALPHRTQIQQAFGRHDVGHIQAHVGGAAAEGAAAMGATAFAVGDHVAFGEAPDLHTAAHEAAHVVQQRAGVQLRGGVGEAGDRHEQHADAVADLVVQGRSAEALLDQYAAPSTGSSGAAASGGAVQRHAFIKGKQVLKTAPGLTDRMLASVKDDLVRDYEKLEEFQAHADGNTDYLGNLQDDHRTWLRYSPDGLNLLGEAHETDSSLEHVLAAVRGKKFIPFIYEPFASEAPPAGSQLTAAHDAYNADRYKALGIDNEKDKRPFGAEPLPPKLGFTMAALLPYLNDSPGSGDDVQNVHRLIQGYKNSAKAIDDYVGKLFLGMLQMAWAYAKDATITVVGMHFRGVPVPPKLDALAQVVGAVRGSLDPYITGLPVHGWLGDTLVRPENAGLLAPLRQFAQAMVDMMTERAISDPSSGLDAKQQKQFAGTTTNDEKRQMFLDWRNRGLHRAVQDAAARKVRYAGMGFNHIEPLAKAGLPPNVHVVHDEGFTNHTNALRAKAVKQR